MKKTFTLQLSHFGKQLVTSVLLLCSSPALFAQVTGTKTIGIDYATLAAAISDLNTVGISGSVIINVPAGYTETAPTGGYVLGSATLNASTSATSTLTFQKSGSGIDPLFTAPVGASLTVDGIFIIQGTDYVIINGIDLTESALNITPLTQMEWGYSLVKLQNIAPFDGCQDVTIENCTITLNQTNTASVGIYSGTHIATDNTPLTITATTDATNNCIFTGNTITNVNRGFSLTGFTNAATPYNLYDQGNTIGGATTTLGNTITNFGGTTTATYGIYLAAQNNALAQNNTITSATVPGSGASYAVFHGVGNNSSFTVSGNTIQMTASTGAIYGIANGNGTANSGINGTGTLTITNNVFQNYSFTATNGSTHYFGVYNYGGTTAGWALGSLIMSNNTVQNMTDLSATSNIYLFYNYYCNSNDVRFNNNKINDLFRSSTSGSTYCYYNYYGNPTAGADSAVGNKITNVSSPYYLYGLYEYMGTTTRDRIIMNDTLMNDTASKNSTFYYLYGIYSYYGNNITISNCLLSNLYGTPSNSGYIYAIYRYYGNIAVISNNIETNNAAYYYYGIYSYAPAISQQINNNLVSNISTTTGGGYGLYSYSSGTNNVYNNDVENISATGSSTFYGIYNSGGTTENFYNDTVYNIQTTGGSIYGFYNGGGTTISVYNNAISDLINTGTTGGSVYGLYATSGTTLNFYQNLIDTVTAGGTTSGNGYGIYESGPSNFNCYKNKISYISANGTGSSVNGMYLNSGIVTAYNNLVGDLRTPNYTTGTANSGTQLVGIYCGAGSNYYIYYNTVDINATSTGVNFGSTAIYASTTPNVTLRNNVFVNGSTSAGTGMVAAYRRSSTTITTYLAASNNNLFYAGTPGPTQAILWDGTTAYTTLAAYKALVTPIDNASVTENVTFQSLSGIANSFLHPSTTVPTQIESDGVNITGITDDIYGTIRAGNTGYTGTGVAPDLGAVEDNYIANDLSAPNITYTPLAFTCSTGDRTFTATITDITGVPLSGSYVPRIYYMKDAGTWYSQPGTLTSGTSTSGTWSFTILASDMGGLVIGDVVSYFVIAQDLVATPNVGSDPFGVVASDVNTITTYPTPNTYAVSASLAGSYNVGLTGAYTTITAAVNAYNTSCITGPVTFVLTDATYPSETFPITITSNVYTSPVNTLTIIPGTGVAATITGTTSSIAIFKLLDARYVTIDGLNTGGSSITLNNMNTGTSTAIWLASSGIGNKDIFLNNMNINGGSNSNTSDWGILSGLNGATPSSTPGADNDTVTIQGNTFLQCGYGIYANGTAAISAGGLDNWTISNNTIGPSSSGATNIGYNGIYLGDALNAIISGNTIQYIGYTGSTSQPVGIYLTSNVNGITVSQNNINNVTANAAVSGTGSNAGMYFGSNVINGTVTRNYVTSISNTNTGGWGTRGITINTGNTASNLTFSNNMISDIWCYADANFLYDPVGIDIDGTSGGVSLYFNSINLFGPHTGYSSGTTFAADVYMNSSGGSINVQDNIFVNSYDNTTSSTDESYTIYSTFASTYYGIMDYNDYYVAPPTGVLAYLGSNLLTLAAIQTSFGSNTHSINTAPVFVSNTNLHLQVLGSNAPLVSGLPITGISVDIDGTTRSLTTPVMGAHEVNIPACTSITAGTVNPVTAAFCASGSTVLNLIGATAGLGIIYQWESSTDSLSWTIIGGATTNTYTTPVITATTFYRSVLVCSFSGASDSATTKVTIHPLPTISVTPDGGGICSAGSGLGMTASGAAGYTWSPATGLSAVTGAFVIATPAIATTYTVTGTDTFGCENTHASTVSVTMSPSSVTVTPNTATFCSGGSQLLTASSAVTGPGTALSLNFNTGLGSWTIDNTGTTTTYPDVTWTVHPDGYINELGTYHSPDLTAFILTNSDTAGAGATVHTMLISPSFSLAGYTAATLTFQQAYEYYFSDVDVNAEISTDGGTTWTVLVNYAGASIGSTTSFVTESIDLSSYLGLPDVMIRFNYLSTYGYYWALDNIAVSGTLFVPVTNITWSPTTGLYSDAALTIPYTGTVTPTVYAAPTAFIVPSVNTYTATATNGTCTDTGTAVITVNPLPDSGVITGPSSVCVGSSITLTDTISGGTWASSNASATVSGGLVTGITAGIDTISYTVTNVCGAATTTMVITVNPLPGAGTITGADNVCVGSSITLTDAVPGGVWSSSSTDATVTGGTVTGAIAGTAIISYAVTNVCGAAFATMVITVNPMPNAGSVSGASSVCVGSHITLSDIVAGGIWSSSNITIATVTGAGIVTGASAGATIISYAVTNVCGTAFATMAITVNPLPNAGSITGPSTVCVGSSITLTDAVPGGIWSSSNAFASVAGGIVTGNTAGVDVISYAVTNICGTAVATETVTINPLPDAGTIMGASSMCIGASVTLSDIAVGGVWSSSNNAIATVTATGIVSGVSSGSPIISYTVTNSCGTAIATLPVSVYPLPNVYNVTGGGTYCTGGTGVNVGLSGSLSGTSYQLFVGAMAVGSAMGGTGFPLNFGLQTAAGTYIVVATNALGCSANMAGDAIVIINPVTPPSVSISTGVGDTICAGALTTFTPVPVNGGATPAYVWYVNGVAVSTSSTYAYYPANGDVVSVLITSSACAIPDTASSSVTMTVTTFEMPSVSIAISTGADSSCAGYPVTFTAVPVYGGAAPTFVWTENGINVATGPEFTYTPTDGDTLYVTMETTFPCALSNFVSSSIVIMHVTPLLLPGVTITASPGLNISSGASDTLTAHVSNGGADPGYQWKINGVTVAGATSATFISNSLANGDIVSCYVTSSGLCNGLTADISVIISISNVGIKSVTGGINDIRVLPNPNTGTFTIKGTLNTIQDEYVSLEITDMLGQVVYEDKVLAQKGQINEQITLSNTLASGMYILNVRTDTDNFVFHFVLEQN